MTGDAVINMPTASPPLSPLQLDPSPPPTTRARQRSGLVRLTVDVPSHRPPTPSLTAASNPRWRSPEFLFYYVAALVVIPLMVWVPMRLSSPDHPNYPFYQHRLARGWIGGRAVDNSDVQYRSFRSNIPYLALLVSLFFALKWVFTRAALAGRAPKDDTYRVPFLLAFEAMMLLVLHGASALKVLAILSVNYVIARAFGPRMLGPVATWIFNGGVLFLNEWYGGYRFGALSPALAWLDSIAGVYPRWHVSFNITMLRLVSFSLDYYWACRRAGPSDTGDPLPDKLRTSVAHPLELYSFGNYIAYTLYPPLYIAGPIMTFNDFIWQLRRPIAPSTRTVFSYAIRFLACFMTMELLLHYTYVVAIKDAHAWAGASAAELCMIGFWNLIIVWLKLLLPWRFFRLWALADGLSPPENMLRCMANNYSALGFWRAWHRSYHLWIVRYIHIPLGGGFLTTVLVFSFVALWHDLSFKLLAWGWLVSLFILPELGARAMLPAKKFGKRWWFRHVCAAGAVGNVLMMMGANLVGFVVGVDGVKYLVAQVVDTWEGVGFMLFACSCLFIGVQLMFEYREEEAQRGIYRRC